MPHDFHRRALTQKGEYEDCGIVSCIIPYYFNRWGTGSHLYTAHTNTVRSDHWELVLLALVGAPCLGLPFPHLLYLLYHNFCGLSRGFRSFCRKLFSLLDSYYVIADHSISSS